MQNLGDNLAGAITYAIHYYTNPKKIALVSNESFIPMPSVESEVICMEVLKTHSLQVENEKRLFLIIKYAFMQRRKTLVNSLVNAGVCSKEKILSILEELNIDKNIRGEKLSLEDFANIEKMI